MTFLKRLRMLPVVLGVAATLAAVSTALFGDGRNPGPANPGDPTRPDGGRVIEDLAITKFSKLPVLTYQLRDGDTLFAWQIKPTVNPTPIRPRDVLVLVDTSASQGGRPLQQARRIVASLPGVLNSNDRVSVWVINTPAGTHALTKNFVPANADEVQHAATALTEVEYGSGATDLKNALDKTLATLVRDRNRQQIVLLLGDGESSFNPVSEDDRFAIGSRMDIHDVFFFGVPLGLKVNPQNLHGFAALTGGAVVRLQEDLDNPVKRGEFMARLTAAFNVPVVKVDKAKFGDEVGEVFPSKLPPLRADRTTLVMGKLAKPAATALSLTVKGTVAGRDANLNFNQELPAPQIDHFFLNLMINQWRGAPHKDAPAMLQSDRALALASTQVKLYRDEFLVQAVWAVRMDRWEDATKLYNAAQKIDPNDREAAAGLLMIEKLKNGKLTKAEIEKNISADVSAIQVAPNAVAQKVIQNIKQDPPAGAGAPGAPAPGGALPREADDILKQAEAKRRIEEQRFKVLTDTTIRRARQLLRTDPDSAYADLKRQRDEILSYNGIGNDARTQMAADIEAVMREIFTKGAEIKRQAEAEREAIGRTTQRLDEFNKEQDEQARVKNRIDQFRNLMRRARFDMAYQESQIMIQERVSKGQSIPTTVTASYIIGQQATQLREWKELVRIREDRFLLSMMQTEKALIPYPDEPPVHFPPASVWRELTSLRREAYLNQNLGNKPTSAMIELKDKIENQEVPIIEGNLNDMSLIDLLTFISKKTGVTFVIMDEYFTEAMGIKEKKPNVSSTRLNGLKLGTFLDLVLASLGATFIVRPDYVEITTFDKRLEEKVTRVFPAADLVIPIPSTVSQQNLLQNLSIQNQQLAIFGAVLGAQNFLGGGGGFQVGGGMMGQMGMQGQVGQFGQNLGQNFGQGFGQGQQNMIGNQNNNNQGFGGGQFSIGGGQLGQFGNLGGQFGLQGGDQSKLLTNLIVETVAKGEWSNVPPPRPLPGMDQEDLTIVPTKQLNSLGYYPPARALIVRGTSRYHPSSTVKLTKKGDGGQAAGPMNPQAPGGPVVIGPDSPDPVKPKPNNAAASNPAKDPNAGAVAIATEPGAKPTMVDPNEDPEVLRKKLSADPKRMWSEAIDWTITDPGVIVACAEFLIVNKEYAAAAEVLKGGMRKGLTTDSWAHEALAIALQESQGAPIEVERAALSAIDLDPNDSKAYIKAAKAEAELKNFDQAIAFCKRAAEFEPDQPLAYANTLVYAERASDVKTDAVVWAADNLLKRDWNVLDVNYHKQVNERLPKLISKFEAAGQKTDTIRRTLAEQTQRDLVIELVWQGPADLDLIVQEPSGSICSATHKRTTGGGVLKGDLIDQLDGGRSEAYTAAMAFSGTYKVSVKKVMGRSVGDTAMVKVTRFKGTRKESFDLIPIDLKVSFKLSDQVIAALKNENVTESVLAKLNPLKNKEFSRVEFEAEIKKLLNTDEAKQFLSVLLSHPENKSVEVKLEGGSRTELATIPEESEYRLSTTGAPVTNGISGFGGGFGTAGSLMSSEVSTATPQGLPVVNVASETRLPGIGSSAADLRVSVKVNPDRQTLSLDVNPVFGTGKNVTMPKVPLLPGGEGK